MRVFIFFMVALATRAGSAQSLTTMSATQTGKAAVQSVTGDQLEQILAAAHGKADAIVAKQLYSLEPSTRIGSATIERCQPYLSGPKSKQAFTALADWSVFSSTPASEIPALAVPDIEAQRKMLALTTAYVARTLHHLPNFYATRTTATFGSDLRPKMRLHLIGKHGTTVYYRDGDELVRGVGRWSRVEGLTTRGEFGTILGTAMLDAAKGNLTWDRWEQVSSGPVAVFAYEVAASVSHYQVDGRPAAYRGEIVIDPSNGTILRLLLKSEMDAALEAFPAWGNALKVADIEVDYGPVNIGGKLYISPLKGVALSETGNLMWLNDVEFADYHLFRGDVRILSGFQNMQ